MAEALASSPAYWDYLQHTTEEVLGQTPWESSEAAGYDFRVQLAPEENNADCNAMFILHETRQAPNSPSRMMLEYMLRQTFAPGSPVLSARHILTYDLNSSLVTAHQKIEGPITEKLRQDYPVFVIPAETEQECPVQPSDYELLAKGLTQIRRFRQLSNRAV